MATNISTNTKNALIAATRVVINRIRGAVNGGGFQSDADTLVALPTVTGLPTNNAQLLFQGIASQRQALANIQAHGRDIMTPVLMEAGREAGSTVIQGNTVSDWPRLFRDISADLLGGTPDYVADRDVSFANNPGTSATGIFRRLTVDHLSQQIDDGYHNQVIKARIVSKPARYRASAVLEGESNTFDDALDYKDGRPVRSAPIPAINDATAPQGISNPYLTPGDTTDEADITSISNWTITTTGTPVFKAETTAANLWRSRSSAIRFTGDNTEAIELIQNIPASVLASPYRPWDVGVWVRLESGWQGTIDVTIGDTTQQFTHANLTAGEYVPLFLDLDADLYPVNFDDFPAQFKVKFTNSQNNTQSIWCAGYLIQGMTQHEGLWYSHWSDDDEPEVEDTVSWSDTCDFQGKIQDVLSFLYHDLAPGWAHLPSSGATTIADPTSAPEIYMEAEGTAVDDTDTVALGATDTMAQPVAILVRNDGNAPLALAVPAETGSPTNASLTNAGLSIPAVVEPGYELQFTIQVTPGGAGAYDIDILFANNDADESAFTLTITGTAS